jgi:hypothetical protein
MVRQILPLSFLLLFSSGCKWIAGSPMGVVGSQAAGKTSTEESTKCLVNKKLSLAVEQAALSVEDCNNVNSYQCSAVHVTPDLNSSEGAIVKAGECINIDDLNLCPTFALNVENSSGLKGEVPPEDFKEGGELNSISYSCRIQKVSLDVQGSTKSSSTLEESFVAARELCLKNAARVAGGAQ